LFEAEEQGVAEEATAAERNADDGTAAGVAHAGDARSQEDQGTTAEGDYAAARELQQTRTMKEMADRVAGGVITDWEGDKPQAATRKEDDTASTVLLAQTIAGLDQKEPAGTKSAEETAAPDPMAAIFSDTAPVPNSSSEGFAAELFQKSIVHSSPRHSPLAAEGRPAHGAGAGAGDGLGASISLPRVAIEDASAEAGASALTPRALDELVFMAAKDFAQPATVEDRCLVRSPYHAFDVSFVLLVHPTSVLRFCLFSLVMRVCACDVWRTMIAEADAAFVDIQDPGPRQPREKGREAG
jgi:hypothetical protein